MKAIAILLVTMALSVSACASAAQSRVDEAVGLGAVAAHPMLAQATSFLPDLSFANQQYAEQQKNTVTFCAMLTQYLSTVNAYSIRQGLPGYIDEPKRWETKRKIFEANLGTFGNGLTKQVKGYADALMGNPSRIEPSELAMRINQACLLEYWHPQTRS